MKDLANGWMAVSYTQLIKSPMALKMRLNVSQTLSPWFRKSRKTATAISPHPVIAVAMNSITVAMALTAVMTTEVTNAATPAKAMRMGAMSPPTSTRMVTTLAMERTISGLAVPATCCMKAMNSAFTSPMVVITQSNPSLIPTATLNVVAPYFLMSASSVSVLELSACITRMTLLSASVMMSNVPDIGLRKAPNASMKNTWTDDARS